MTSGLFFLMIAYLNLIHGADETAALGNHLRPYRTLAALQAAITTWGDAQAAFDTNPQTQNHRRACLIVDQGSTPPSQFIPIFL